MTKEHQDLNRKILNYLHICILFICMTAIMSFLGYLIAGIEGVLWAIFMGLLIILISPKLSPGFIFSLYKARRLTVANAPGLYRMISDLSDRANLAQPPELYYVPSQIMNAFSIGTPENAAIGVSDALLNTLSTRELVGVLAHEISHIQHNDLRLMSYADIISRITNSFSLAGLLLVLINLPLHLLGMVTISWFALAVLIITPGMMGVLQSSLSRIREFEADLQAAALTGDPEGLARALGRFEFNETSSYDLLARSGHGATVPSILRTHPATEERIKRLLSSEVPKTKTLEYETDASIEIPVGYKKSIRKPRWHIGGIWY
jgi:heat shock protein HtpX